MVPPPGRVCASLEACSRFVSSGFGGRCPLSLALTAYLPPSPPFGVAPRGSPPLLSGGSHVCVTTSGTASPFSGALPAFSSRHGFSRFSPSPGIGSPPAACRLLHPLGLRRLPTSHFLGNVSRLLSIRLALRGVTGGSSGSRFVCGLLRGRPLLLPSPLVRASAVALSGTCTRRFNSREPSSLTPCRLTRE